MRKRILKLSPKVQAVIKRMDEHRAKNYGYDPSWLNKIDIHKKKYCPFCGMLIEDHRIDGLLLNRGNHIFYCLPFADFLKRQRKSSKQFEIKLE